MEGVSAPFRVSAQGPSRASQGIIRRGGSHRAEQGVREMCPANEKGGGGGNPAWSVPLVVAGRLRRFIPARLSERGAGQLGNGGKKGEATPNIWQSLHGDTGRKQSSCGECELQGLGAVTGEACGV